MYFHLLMTALMDEETQKKGAVGVVYAVNSDDGGSNGNANPKSMDPIVVWEATKLLLKAIPIRIEGTHICTNPSSLGGKFFSSMARFAGDAGMVRARFHQGSFDEINESLSSFGINNILQVVSSHSANKKKIEKQGRERLYMVKAVEHAKILTPDKLIVVVPSSTDVLLGRGKPIQNHPGNMRLGLIAESLLTEYDELESRQDKTRLAERTMIRMKQAGVRFLTKDNYFWELANDRMARDRISSTFRTVRDRLANTDSSDSTKDQVRKRSIETNNTT